MSGNFVDGAWREGEDGVWESRDPGNGEVVWRGKVASAGQVGGAVERARGAFGDWSRRKVEERVACVEAFGKAVGELGGELLEAICRETGKPRWEAKTECDAVVGKIGLTKLAMGQRQGGGAVGVAKDGAVMRYRPVGVVGVLGPFNLPVHLPNGQIVPALLAGNTVVFKPSEMTPLVGEVYGRCWERAGLPAGVFNMVQGGREVGAALAGDAGIDGVLFTGSRGGGVALSKMLAEHPEKMLALEMGGNNPLVVTGVGEAAADVDAAVYAIVQSAFITAGQRCTCARRLILMKDREGDRVLERLVGMTRGIAVGHFSGVPEPFMGPVISVAAAGRLRESYEGLLKNGGVPLVQLKSLGQALLMPAIVDVTEQKGRVDEEMFGPILQVIRVGGFAEAVAEASRTAYGLAAGLLSQDRALWERFSAEVRAGIVNWNRPTTGASGAMPFGGVGWSGNHRPAGFFAIDFCADPVACMEAETLALPKTLSPGIRL